MSPRRISALAFLFALLPLESAIGQRGPTAPRTPTAQPGGTITTPNTPNAPNTGIPSNSIPGSINTQPGQQQQIPQQFPEQPRPIFLSGRVMTDDGTVPDGTAELESVCNGVQRKEAYTDSKGRFSFQLGDRNSGVFQDASVGSESGAFGRPGASSQTGGFDQYGGRTAFGDRSLLGCELQAVLPGYRSDAINLSNRKSLDNPEVGTIVLHRVGVVEGKIISATALAAPKDARKAFDKGQNALKKNKPEEAIKSFEKATQAYPEYAPAWYELGKLQFHQRQTDDARRSFEAAIKADPKYLEPYLSLALIQAQGQQWKQLGETTAQVLKLDPYDYPQAYFFNAVANYNTNNIDAAEKSAREAEKLDTRRMFPGSWKLLGVILADRREFAEATGQMKSYLTFAPKAADADAVRARIAQIEKLSGEPAQAQQK